MKNIKIMDNKQKYNRKRRIIFCILGLSAFVGTCIFMLFSIIATCMALDDGVITIVGIIWAIYICVTFFIAMDITLYKHPVYGEFTFADEFKTPKKYKYKDINFTDFIEAKLISENYLKYNSDLDFIKGFYYYKPIQKNHYSIVLFINQEITKKIYKDFTENSLCSFLDILVDKGILDDWNKIYFTIIVKEDSSNEVLNDFINYNLPLPENIGVFPIVVSEESKYIKIANYDYGLGLNEFDQIKKALLADIDDYLIKKSKKVK